MNQGDQSKYKLLNKNFIHDKCIIGLPIEIIPNIISMVHKCTSGRHCVDQLPEQLDVSIVHKTYSGKAISVTLTVPASTPLHLSLRYTHDSDNELFSHS